MPHYARHCLAGSAWHPHWLGRIGARSDSWATLWLSRRHSMTSLEPCFFALSPKWGMTLRNQATIVRPVK
jgi:hypothetical protein